MCLLFVAWQTHPRYRLVLAGNRDEFHRRPTAPAGFWEDYPQVAAGRDLQAGGTWLGITRAGRYAAVTNYREGTPPDASRSRGELVRDALLHDGPLSAYLRGIRSHGGEYRGFNLLAGDQEGLYYFSNRDGPPRRLEAGIYGLSNGLLDTPWPKVRAGRAAFARLLQRDGDLEPAALLALLADDRPAPDAELPATGVSLSRERWLSALFIRGQDYGTRSSSVILIDHEGKACLLERRFRPDGSAEGETRLDFRVATEDVGAHG